MERKRRVLIVEDQPTQADVWERATRRGGFDVDVVHSADEGVSALRNKYYDAAVVDMNLSDIENDNSGGEEVLGYARSLREAPALVVFTAYEDPQFAADTIQEWGVARFLSKSAVTKHGVEALLHAITTAIASIKLRVPPREEVIRVFAGGELEKKDWVEGAIWTFGCGFQDFAAFIEELLSDLAPLLPPRGTTGPSLRAENENSLIGRFWSKGIGAAVIIEITSLRPRTGNLATTAVSVDMADRDLVREYSHLGLRGRVWKTLESTREVYGS